MIADTDLPVWSIRPNWAQGITERLSWLTDILASSYGPEQRRALRLSPRREFEMTFNPIDSERSYFDLFLHRLGSLEFMVPLFHDRGRLSAPIVAGATAIPFDTTYREFAIGDLAIILGDNAFTFDKVVISGLTDAGITVLAGGVTRAWPKGASIYPLRRSRISQESMFSALTNRVGEASLEFQLNQANDIPDEGEWAITYGDYPLLLDKPNRRENLDLSYIRNALLLDNEHGLSALADDAGRAFTISTNSYMLEGRAAHWAMRQMLYRLRGAQGSIWVPSFNRDFELSRDRDAADALLDIKNIGYVYTGGAISGRTHVLIGSTTAEITTTGVGLTADEERLTLAGPLGVDIPAGTFGSFLEPCRLSDDTVEIVHHTDTNGVAECQLNFRSFRDERTEPAILSSPIPIEPMADAMCGAPAPEEADCVNLETGYFAKLFFDYDVEGNLAKPGFRGGMNITFYRGGVAIAGVSSFSNTGTWSAVYNEFGQVLNETCLVDSDAYNYTTDDNPFAGGPPDRIRVQQQYGAFAFPPPGESIAQLYFNLIGDGPVILNVTSGGAGINVPSGIPYGPGTFYYRTVGLWPLVTDFIGAP